MDSSNKKRISRVQGSWAGQPNKSPVTAQSSVSTVKTNQSPIVQLTYKEDKDVSSN